MLIPFSDRKWNFLSAGRVLCLPPPPVSPLGARVCVLQANRTRGFGTSGTHTGASRSAARLVQYDRRAARHPPPRQISPLKESREERGWAAHSCCLWGSAAPLWPPSLRTSIVAQLRLISGCWICDAGQIHSPYRRSASAFQRALRVHGGAGEEGAGGPSGSGDMMDVC